MTFVGSSSRPGSWQEHDFYRTAPPSPIRSKQGVSRPCSVATHAPANDNDQIAVLVLQAPGEEITITLLAAAAPLGYALGDPSAQAPAQASIILIVLSVAPVADPLAEATPHILPVVKKVDDEITQILPRFHPVPNDIAQVTVRIATVIAPALS
jgi:hypothetical protein